MKNTEKRIITWKDADQNLCLIAALILEDALEDIRLQRGKHPFEKIQKTTDGETLEEGWMDTNQTTWQSGDADTEAVFQTFFPLNTETSVICWYSFQNMVRLRLKDARADLKKNLFGEGNGLKTSKQLSRNPKGRSGKSKFGRQPER